MRVSSLFKTTSGATPSKKKKLLNLALSIDGVKFIKLAFKKRLQTAIIENSGEKIFETVSEFLLSIRHKIVSLVSRILLEHESIKISFELFVEVNISTKNLKDIISLQTKAVSEYSLKID